MKQKPASPPLSVGPPPSPPDEDPDEEPEDDPDEEPEDDPDDDPEEEPEEEPEDELVEPPSAGLVVLTVQPVVLAAPAAMVSTATVPENAHILFVEIIESTSLERPKTE